MSTILTACLPSLILWSILFQSFVCSASRDGTAFIPRRLRETSMPTATLSKVLRRQDVSTATIVENGSTIYSVITSEVVVTVPPSTTPPVTTIITSSQTPTLDPVSSSSSDSSSSSSAPPSSSQVFAHTLFLLAEYQLSFSYRHRIAPQGRYHKHQPQLVPLATSSAILSLMVAAAGQDFNALQTHALHPRALRIPGHVRQGHFCVPLPSILDAVRAVINVVFQRVSLRLRLGVIRQQTPFRLL